jgi:hypothetical protein
MLTAVCIAASRSREAPDMDSIAGIFERLDRWRHLPNYQLERRADIFFALYLHEALSAKLGFAVSEQLVPEFPVRFGSLDASTRHNRSFKIDYLALSADGRQPVFAELKTEMRSRRDEQDRALLAACQAGLACLLDGVLDLFCASDAKHKYLHLLHQLEQLGLLAAPQALYQAVASGDLKGAAREVQNVRNLARSLPAPRVVYVQPYGEGEDVISFAEFAACVARHDDPFSRRFAQSLGAWAGTKANNGPAMHRSGT